MRQSQSGQAWRPSSTPADAAVPAGGIGRRPVAVAIAAGGIFSTEAVMVHENVTRSADRSFELTIHADLPASLHQSMVVLSAIGDTAGITMLTTVLVALLLWKRLYPAAVFAAMTPALAVSLETTCKALLRRPRPHLWAHAQILHSFSFPSGHSTASAALAVAVITIAVRYVPRGLAAVLAAVAAAFALAVGLSRMYLGVHWPSDVAGGFILAVFSGAVVLIVVDHTTVRRSERVSGRGNQGKTFP